jgi:hypothetical protein|tara:strand:- start:326 stop:634 length:309 start_codon:yes stop_codon:yes gene_type:complete
MMFLSCPPVYHLPGTWTKCKDAIIPHGNLDPKYGIIVFFVLLLLFLVGWGLYLTFGPGKEDLKDQIDEHAKMHELGIAHGHEGKRAFITTKEKYNPRHKHDE